MRLLSLLVCISNSLGWVLLVGDKAAVSAYHISKVVTIAVLLYLLLRTGYSCMQWQVCGSRYSNGDNFDDVVCKHHSLPTWNCCAGAADTSS